MSQRYRPGEVRDAITACLRGQDGGKSIGEIRDAVHAQLGEVPASSIRSYLRLNAGEGGQFERLTRGRYRLRG